VATTDSPNRGAMAIFEMKEFATFPAGTQRYIRRSLDIALHREDAVERWSRDLIEQVNIRVQARYYERLPEIRELIPDDTNLDQVEPFIAPLVAISAFDLAQNRLPTFGAYRFLYERTLGPQARPWLVGAFCAAAALPHIAPAARLDMLTSISENAATAAGWSNREPSFYPDWVDKDEDQGQGRRLLN
jgi:hypothetical protein